jgi:hypothetical protein
VGSGWNMPEGVAELCQWELPAGAGDGLACRSGPRKVRASCLPGVPGACAPKKQLAVRTPQHGTPAGTPAAPSDGRTQSEKERGLFLSVCCVLALGAKVEIGRASSVGCHVPYRSLYVPNRLGNHTAIAE